jgi:hypothetical protein
MRKPAQNLRGNMFPNSTRETRITQHMTEFLDMKSARLLRGNMGEFRPYRMTTVLFINWSE